MEATVYPDLEQLPQFPAIATKVLRLLSHEETRIGEIGALVRADAALTSAALRLANSALYTSTVPVTSIERAVTMVGFEELKRLVLAVSMKGCFQATMRLDLMRAIWRHSLACALLCDELSVACSPTQSRDDSAYTAGLLHDIGRLGLCAAHPREYTELLTAGDSGAARLEDERRTFGLDHCQAGAWLAGKWDLPASVRTVAASHHEAPHPSASDIPNLVKIAVLLCESLGFDIRPPARACTMAEIRKLLPHTAQFRFDPDPDDLKSRIAEKLDTYD